MTQSKEGTKLEFPPLYLLKFNIESSKLLALELEIGDPLVRDLREAKVVIGNISQKKRALLEFRIRHVYTEEVVDAELRLKDEVEDAGISTRARKRRKTEKNPQGKEVITVDSSTESEDESSLKSLRKTQSPHSNDYPRFDRSINPNKDASTARQVDVSQESLFNEDTIRVCNWAWYFDSVKAGILLPTTKYNIYTGRIIEQPKYIAPREPTKISSGKEILARARADTPPRPQYPYNKHKHRRSGSPGSQPMSQRPHLLQETTEDHDQAEELPPLPPYLALGTYSCERPTLLTGPNDEFITQLKKIKFQRMLTRDDKDMSALAYSKAIAAIAAYPFTITIPQEIQRLPNCGPKYVSLYQEWRETGTIREAEEYEADEYLNTLKLFYDVFDVGAKTARQWYAKGWRDLDDVQIHGWDSLDRTQQVGIKYYTDFKTKIPRLEVESIATTIFEHAKKLRPGIQMVIVGGYRRGKPDSGDVDVILTHPDETATLNFIEDIVEALYIAKYIAQTLRISTATSNRGQEPVSWKGSGPSGGTGFCTLDKAFLAWQDPEKLADGTNIMRRVDIIISPWKVAGCAVLGWSGATQFERDLRRICRKRGFKFDSSGVRNLEDGAWLDLEGDEETLLGKEKRVFAGLGLEWREPTERCTG